MAEIPKMTKTLVLTVEVPDYWADHLDEAVLTWTEGEEPSPEDHLERFTEEEMDERAVLVVKVLSQGEDDDRLVGFDARIVAVAARDGR